MDVVLSLIRSQWRHFIKHLIELKNQFQLISQGTLCQLNFGYVGAVIHSFLPFVLKELKNLYPHVNTVLSEMTSDAQILALKNGLFDIGLIKSPIETNHLIAKPIFRETFSIIFSSDHSLAGHDHIPLTILQMIRSFAFPVVVPQ